MQIITFTTTIQVDTKEDLSKLSDVDLELDLRDLIENDSVEVLSVDILRRKKIHNRSVCISGKASFYACTYETLKKAALECGWALGLHGSLNSDMDIMAMPWTENATSVEIFIQRLSDCFTDNVWKDNHIKPSCDKPNGRIVYTMSIYGNYYLDINIIENKPKEG